MTLFRLSADRFEPVLRTSFAAERVLERKDLQRLLRADLTPIGDDIMVIAEEYGDWEDSNRRIDLLCLTKDADIVVVEIKRTDDGGHMELQAVRYAAMVSGMTLDQVIAAYARSSMQDSALARSDILDFLELDGDADATLSGNVRIVLVSADFSTELTTAVLWLNKHDLDIRCIRLRPHRLGSELLIDATQIIPLPEAAEYEVKLREQEHAKRKVEREKFVICRAFWASLLERAQERTRLFAGRSTRNGAVLPVGMGRGGFSLNAVLEQSESRVEMFYRPSGDEEHNQRVFNAVFARKAELEAEFGEPLMWDDRPGRLGWKVLIPIAGGWRTPEAEWPAVQDRMIDAIIRMERVLRTPILEASA